MLAYQRGQHSILQEEKQYAKKASSDTWEDIECKLAITAANHHDRYGVV